jgi:hypothetical protein
MVALRLFAEDACEYDPQASEPAPWPEDAEEVVIYYLTKARELVADPPPESATDDRGG